MNKIGYVGLIVFWMLIIIINAVNYFTNHVDKGWIFGMGIISGIGLMFSIHLLMKEKRK